MYHPMQRDMIILAFTLHMTNWKLEVEIRLCLQAGCILQVTQCAGNKVEHLPVSQAGSAAKVAPRPWCSHPCLRLLSNDPQPGP